MPKPLARRLRKHLDEKSVFKHNLDVERKQESGKVIKFDHKSLRKEAVDSKSCHRHKPTPAPQTTNPPKLRQVDPRQSVHSSHRFNVRPSVIIRRGPLLPPAGIPTRQQLLKKEFVVNPDNPFLTYYVPVGGSFGVVGKNHMANLPHAGWNVRWVILEQAARTKMGYPSPIGVIHPLLYWGIPGWSSAAGRQHFRQAHKKLVGYEVADSDAIGKNAVSLVNKVDLLMVPSETAKRAFVNSGLKTRIEVVQHGVSDNYNAPKNPLPEISKKGIKILYFELHSKWRKGGDVVKKVMCRVLPKRDVKLVVKGGKGNSLYKLPQTFAFSNWMREADLVRLYDSCDILFAPSRGGAFELNVLEAMARGLVVVTISYPSIKEYAEDALFIKDKGQVRVLPGNSIHIGKGSDPDPDHAYELMNYAIDNLDELKQKAEALAPRIRQKYNWRNTAKRMAKILGSLQHD